MEEVMVEAEVGGKCGGDGSGDVGGGGEGDRGGDASLSSSGGNEVPESHV